MRRLSTAVTVFLAAAGFTGCSEAGPVDPELAVDPAFSAATFHGPASAASSETVRGEVQLNINVPATCFDGGLVHFEGPVRYRIHTSVDARGVQHGQAFYHWDDVVASMGAERWHTTAGVEAYMVTNYEFTNPFLPIPQTEKTGDPAVFHHSGALRFRADGDAPDLYVRHVVQLVSNAGGSLRVDRHVLELLDCH